MFANLITAPLGLPAPARHPARFLRVIPGVAKSVARWLETRRQLRALSELDDHLLVDIGLSREDVKRASSRPFWMRHLRNSRQIRSPHIARGMTVYRLRSAFLLSGFLIASGATQAVSQ